ncbi:lysophospholipid acyltransferase family protein [Parasulfuritortus cantonensis]|uniref:Lysophospholipid acyltransferase family protein n=1 Tax=Parasulfuritortus cantonensis TaxID=2528202 RepID=A0A4R1B905_9PROT|nr:lysophospholipid acyltransferase family protein [Parasulfuritortus cantonensis]
MRLLFEVLARLPLPVLHGLGGAMGVLSLLRPRHRALLRANLASAGLADRVSLVAVAAALGRGFMELPAVWLRPLDQAIGLIREIHGQEHLAAAQARGKGVLLLAPHLGCWELGGLWFSANYPVTALYRPPPQAWAHELMKAGRERGLATTVPPDRSGVKALLGALKRNEAVFILPDQVANKGDGVWAPFFGRPVYLPALPYRLASATGAAALVMVCERLPHGRGYRLHITPLDELPDAPEAAAARTHAEIERFVRTMPTQYLWSYRIFRRHKKAPPPPPEFPAP